MSMENGEMDLLHDIKTAARDMLLRPRCPGRPSDWVWVDAEQEWRLHGIATDSGWRERPIE